MEKRDYLIYFLVVLFILIAIGLASCTDKSEDSTGTTTSAETEQESMTTTGAVGSIENEVKKLGAASGRYACYDGSMLTTYKNKTKENFEEIVDYFSKLNYEVYSSHEMNDCLFTTLIKNSQMTHVYWLKDSNELNIIVSSKAGDTLPPANPELTTGAYQTTISQMQGSKGAGYLNGMSYIIQLADGTFIIYDGGYADQAPALFQKLCDLNGGGTDGIHIRAWLITHSHNDHYPCFDVFADKYGSNIVLDYLLISAPGSLASNEYLNVRVLEDANKFANDTVVTTVHTGMLFTFCNLKMEIFFTLEELYIDGAVKNFNNTSIVSRLYGDGYSFLILGDAAKELTDRMESIYGTYLKSDVCQVSHHGVEDVPLSLYELIQAPVLFFPCSQALYDGPRAKDVKDALKVGAPGSSTKKIFIHQHGTHMINWGYNPA